MAAFRLVLDDLDVVAAERRDAKLLPELLLLLPDVVVLVRGRRSVGLGELARFLPRIVCMMIRRRMTLLLILVVVTSLGPWL